jgi:hypothetical protein
LTNEKKELVSAHYIRVGSRMDMFIRTLADKSGKLQYQTAAPHIYAAGDVIGFPSLASTSMEQGRLAACHAFDQKMPPPLLQF